MNKIDKQKVLEFQAKIVDKLLDADRECFRLLRKQFEQITVARMQGDSAGFFMYYSHRHVDKQYRLYNINSMIDDLYIGYRNISHVGGFILWINEGYIDCLECYWDIIEGEFDGEWPPPNYDDFQLCYLNVDPDYTGSDDIGPEGCSFSTTYRDYTLSVNKFTCRYLSSQADDYKLRLEKYACKYKLQ